MAAAQTRAAPQPSMTVLIVDDEHQSLKYFAKLFGADFEVLTCTSAQEAEALFEARAGRIAVVISDHRMPATTGVTLLARIKDRWPETVRLLTTAYADTESLAASINEAGIHRYVAKPWDLDDLRDALEEAAQSFARNAMSGNNAGRGDLPPLVGIVAHELATPLLSIELTSKSIIAAVRDEAEQADGKPAATNEHSLQRFMRAARRIGEDAARARRLARSLADLARDTADSTTLKRVSMRACIDRALDTYPFQNRERERVSTLLSDDFLFLGSGLLMSAVITNVISNALDAIRPVVQGKVTITLVRGGAYNTVLVTDTGTGLPSGVELQPIRPFVSSKDNGTGLGLSICDWIVKSYGGSLRLSPAAPHGAQVEIRMPPPSPQVAVS